MRQAAMLLCLSCLDRPCVLLHVRRVQNACVSWASGVESLRQDMAAGQLPSPERVRKLLLSAAATGAALGHMDDLQVRLPAAAARVHCSLLSLLLSLHRMCCRARQAGIACMCRVAGRSSNQAADTPPALLPCMARYHPSP